MANDRSATQASQNKDQEFKPPLPKAAYYIVNPLLTAILRSPFHSLVSGALMLLTFKGRKTGKRYSIPVGYLQKDRELRIFTRSPWWKNLQGDVPVSVRLRGRDIQGSAKLIEDPHVIAEVTHELVATRGEEMARRMGIISESSNGTEQPAATTPGAKFIAIQLDPPAQ